ncbi:MAG: hypothetical protein ACOX62_03395 [Christensenellales bacterium]
MAHTDVIFTQQAHCQRFTSAHRRARKKDRGATGAAGWAAQQKKDGKKKKDEKQMKGR